MTASAPKPRPASPKARSTAPAVSILQALDDPNLFGHAIKNRKTWTAWRALLKALFALPANEAEAEIFRTLTGRTTFPEKTFNEAWLICGRRAGKSFTMALIAVYLAAFKSYRQFLSPGERATIMVIAADRKQARVIMRYVRGLLRTPLLARMVERDAAESIDLNNHATIEIATASNKATRGYTLAAALCDELAFWPTDDSSSPDYEVLDALRPGMATIPGAMLICASSPYAQRGALFDAFKRHWGHDEASVLVWRAPTRVMNPSVPQRLIDEAMERDPASAAAEYMAEFRSDIETFLSREAVETCIDKSVFERAPTNTITYHGFVDPSGGSADSFTAAVAHRSNEGLVVLDAIREIKPPFSPEGVSKELAAFFLSYRIATVRGDKYAGEWPREQFAKFGVTYQPSAKPKSELYQDLLPAINSRRVSLLDNPKLVSQLLGLERRTARGGRDSIDHPPGSHDDIANAVAGVIVSVLSLPGPMSFNLPIVISRPRDMFGGATTYGERTNPALSNYSTRRSPFLS